MGTEGGFAWDSGHKMQCADNTLLSSTLEACMVLQAQKIPFKKRKEKKIESLVVCTLIAIRG